MESWKEMALSEYPNYNGFINPFDFSQDMRRFATVNKMCFRYFNTGDINHKLVINNLVILTNIFSRSTIVAAFDDLCDSDSGPVLNSFLVFMKIKDTEDICEPILDMLEDLVSRY